jgi:hypothetical protein
MTMKAKISLSVLLALAGCMINLNIVAADSPVYPAVPAGVRFFDSAYARENIEIINKANIYLEHGDYDKLDEYASELRNSRESWATGHWKLGAFYAAFSPFTPSESDPAPRAEWEGRIAGLQKWVKAKPDSVSARIALAYTLNCDGWHARGYSDSRFHDQLVRAGAVLDGADKLKERCPVYWSVRMMIALGLGFDRNHFDEICKQATNSAPYYYDAYYFHRAVYLLPRWHGQPGEWEANLAREADQIGGEKGDEVYAQVVWCINRYVSSRDPFHDYHISWARVDRGFAVIEKEYPDSLTAKNERAYMAVLAGEKQAAVKYLGQMGGKVDFQSWHTRDYFANSYNWAHAGL